MSRVNFSVAAHKRHKKLIKSAKGYRGRSKNCFSIAIEKVEKGWQYAYRDRRNRKRDFRSLWIQRINAAVRSYGLTYSKFMMFIKMADVQMNRKMISELAICNPDAFGKLVKFVSDYSGFNECKNELCD